MSVFASIDTLGSIKELLDQEMWQSAEFLSSAFLAGSQGASTNSFQEAQVTAYLGDSYFHRKEYRRALSSYSQALTVLNSGKQRDAVFNTRLALQRSRCYVELNEKSNAIQELEAIPPKAKTVAVHLASAKLYQASKLKRLAITAYKAVLGAQPLAVEVYEVLLSLEVEASELLGFVKEACRGTNNNSDDSSREWLVSLVHMFAHKQGSDYDACVAASTALTRSLSTSANNDSNSNRTFACVLRVLAQAAVMADRTDEACVMFEALLRADPHCAEGMEDYGLILYDTDQQARLNELANAFLGVDDKSDVGWLLAAMFCALKDETDKAKLLVDRAIHYRPASACAYVFKGKLYLANGQSEPAIVAFQQASIMRKDVRSFSHLITAQLAVNKVKEASNAASECLSIAPTAATSHILLGNCLARGTGGHATSDSIRAYQRALELDSRNLMAASLLAQAFSTQDKNREAVQVLTKAIELSSSSSSSSSNSHSPGAGSHRLRTQLARCYVLMEDYAAAIMELHLVIELDPDQTDAVAELERCEQLMGE